MIVVKYSSHHFCHGRLAEDGIYRSNVTVGTFLDTVQVRRGLVFWGEHFCPEEFQDDAAVFGFCTFEGCLLPPLPFISTGIIDIEGTVRFLRSVQFALQLNHPFAGGVDGKPA